MTKIIKLVSCALGLLLCTVTLAKTAMPMAGQPTPDAQALLHPLLFWMAIAISIIAFIILIIALIWQRHSEPQPHFFQQSLLIEITWFIVPLILLALLITPAIRVVLHRQSMVKTSPAQAELSLS